MNQVVKYPFLESENMDKLGFKCVLNKNEYRRYENIGTVHYNTDYNKDFPESPGKVIIAVNMDYSESNPFINITQDGGTRTVYNGVCNNERFLKELLYSIR